MYTVEAVGNRLRRQRRRQRRRAYRMTTLLIVVLTCWRGRRGASPRDQGYQGGGRGKACHRRERRSSRRIGSRARTCERIACSFRHSDIQRLSDAETEPEIARSTTTRRGARENRSRTGVVVQRRKKRKKTRVDPARTGGNFETTPMTREKMPRSTDCEVSNKVTVIPQRLVRDRW